jgi:hypothetical protein
MPQRIVWAWERPEDLRSLDPAKYCVAFLAQTLFLESQNVIPRPRRQPLEVAPGTYMIAVTRIETRKESDYRPEYSAEQIEKIVSLIKNTAKLANVKAVQIDFDVVVSERQFYRGIVTELKKQLPPDMPLTITSLGSWCVGDSWFNDFPIDEAVPMVFEMGADSDKIKTFLRNGNDWNEPLCRGSYGISKEEGRPEGIKDGRRMYYFKDSAWSEKDAAFLK